MTTDHASDRLKLQDVMLDYAAAVDERDRERYSACFAEDVEVIGFGAGTYSGREAWADYVFSALEKYSATQHLLGLQSAEINGDDAQTRTDVQAVHFPADGGPRFTLWGTYHTSMRRSDGRWLIYRHELVLRGTSTD